jgi:hypothetical protein
MIKSADEFKTLRESENQEEYSRAATDEAPLEVWLEVLTKYPDLAFWVAQNKSVPVKILEKLTLNEDSKVRDMVARKRKLPENLMLLLAEDNSDTVRLALANNSKITKKVLNILVNDSWQEVRNKAMEKLAL